MTLGVLVTRFPFLPLPKKMVYTNPDVKGLLYHNYHIIGVARLNQKTGFWIPTVRVRWRDAGSEQKFELNGPQNRFRTKDEAEDYAISMGKDWIDKKNPIP